MSLQSFSKLKFGEVSPYKHTYALWSKEMARLCPGAQSIKPQSPSIDEVLMCVQSICVLCLLSVNESCNKYCFSLPASYLWNTASFLYKLLLKYYF
jgi:hypothetical protein